MTGHISSRLPAYASLAAAGLVAGLALGRVEPVALAAPFLLAIVAAVATHEPKISAQVTLDRDRALEGEEVTATIELSSSGAIDRLELRPAVAARAERGGRVGAGDPSPQQMRRGRSS